MEEENIDDGYMDEEWVDEEYMEEDSSHRQSSVVVTLTEKQYIVYVLFLFFLTSYFV